MKVLGELLTFSFGIGKKTASLEFFKKLIPRQTDIWEKYSMNILKLNTESFYDFNTLK